MKEKKKGDTIRRLEHGLLINIHWEKWDHIIYASPWGTLSANELRQRMLAIMGFLILQDKNSTLCQPGGPSDQPQQAVVGFPALLGSRRCGRLDGFTVLLLWGGQCSFCQRHLHSISSLTTSWEPGAFVSHVQIFPPPHPLLVLSKLVGAWLLPQGPPFCF